VSLDVQRSGRAAKCSHKAHSGWVSYPIRDERAVPGAIDLFRLAYERARARRVATAPGQSREFAEEETKPARAS
jgi:hypothetical protein